MISITLKPDEWQSIVNILAQAPYHIAAPLIEQIRGQASTPEQALPMRGNSHAETMGP